MGLAFINVICKSVANPLQICCESTAYGYPSVLSALGCKQSILHQRADGHWSNATRDRSDKRALWSYLIKLHIALELEAALLCCIRHAGCANIDHHRTFLHHISLDKLRLTDGCNEYIGRSTYLTPRSACPLSRCDIDRADP